MVHLSECNLHAHWNNIKIISEIWYTIIAYCHLQQSTNTLITTVKLHATGIPLHVEVPTTKYTSCSPKLDLVVHVYTTILTAPITYTSYSGSMVHVRAVYYYKKQTTTTTTKNKKKTVSGFESQLELHFHFFFLLSGGTQCSRFVYKNWL